MGEESYMLVVDRFATICLTIHECRTDPNGGLLLGRGIKFLTEEGIPYEPDESEPGKVDQSEFIRLYWELVAILRERFSEDEEVLTKPLELHIDPRPLALMLGGVVVAALVVGYVIYLVVSSVINNS
jgi:hypothetical protein